jgi:hypothetical protein
MWRMKSPICIPEPHASRATFLFHYYISKIEHRAGLHVISPYQDIIFGNCNLSENVAFLVKFHCRHSYTIDFLTSFVTEGWTVLLAEVASFGPRGLARMLSLSPLQFPLRRMFFGDSKRKPLAEGAGRH